MISKFDAVLIGAFLLIAGVVFADLYLIVHGLPEFGSGVWTLVTAASTGEIVTFSLYRVAKQGGVRTVAKTLFGKHQVIDTIEQEEATNGDTQQTDQP